MWLSESGYLLFFCPIVIYESWYTSIRYRVLLLGSASLPSAHRERGRIMLTHPQRQVIDTRLAKVTLKDYSRWYSRMSLSDPDRSADKRGSRFDRLGTSSLKMVMLIGLSAPKNIIIRSEHKSVKTVVKLRHWACRESLLVFA